MELLNPQPDNGALDRAVQLLARAAVAIERDDQPTLQRSMQELAWLKNAVPERHRAFVSRHYDALVAYVKP